MASPFPINQIATPPVLIAERLLPLLNKYIGTLQKLGAVELPNLLENIPTNVTCDDADVRELRNKLEALLNFLEKINDLIAVLSTVVDVLKILARVGQVVAAASLASPVPLPPQVQSVIDSSSQLAQNSLTVANILLSIFNRLLALFPIILKSAAETQQFLNNLCNEDADRVNDFLNNLSGNDTIEVTLVTPPTAAELLEQYPSTFYTELNVSDEDLNSRYQEIVELISNGFDVINNLVELPTAVLTGTGAPTNTTGTAGDFYINTQNNELFGPKPTNGSWT
jgi:hypothetical protein